MVKEEDNTQKILNKVQLNAFRRDLKKVYPEKTREQIDELINKIEKLNKERR